jgi:hypothetical protein
MKINTNTPKVNNQNLDNALKEVLKEPEKLINFYLPKSLHKKLKNKAINEDTTIKEVLTKAVLKYINKELKN